MLRRGVAREYLIRGSETVARVKQVLVVAGHHPVRLVSAAAPVGRAGPRGEQRGLRRAHRAGREPQHARAGREPEQACSAPRTRCGWIVESLQGDRVGLILFSGDAFLQCPLTNDYGAFMMFLDAASPTRSTSRGRTSAWPSGRRTACSRTSASPRGVLVLITDGEDHEGTASEAAAQFREMDVSIYTVGIGRTGGEVIPSAGDETAPDSYYRDAGGRLVRTRKDVSFLKRIAGLTRRHLHRHLGQLLRPPVHHRDHRRPAPEQVRIAHHQGAARAVPDLRPGPAPGSRRRADAPGAKTVSA